MKKTVSVLLVAIMLCTFSFCAFAADSTVSVSIEETADREYTVYLGFNDDAKSVCGGSMNLVYNGDKLKFEDYSVDSEKCMMLINPDYQNSGNTVRFVFASATALSDGKNLATIKFSSSGDKVTSSDFSVSEYRLYDVNSSLIANDKTASPVISFNALSVKNNVDTSVVADGKNTVSVRESTDFSGNDTYFSSEASAEDANNVLPDETSAGTVSVNSASPVKHSSKSRKALIISLIVSLVLVIIAAVVILIMRKKRKR